jgi:hypothetical protein
VSHRTLEHTAHQNKPSAKKASQAGELNLAVARHFAEEMEIGFAGALSSRIAKFSFAIVSP